LIRPDRQRLALFRLVACGVRHRRCSDSARCGRRVRRRIRRGFRSRLCRPQVMFAGASAAARALCQAVWRGVRTGRASAWRQLLRSSGGTPDGAESCNEKPLVMAAAAEICSKDRPALRCQLCACRRGKSRGAGSSARVHRPAPLAHAGRKAPAYRRIWMPLLVTVA